MFAWLKQQRERAKIKCALAQYVTPEAVSATLANPRPGSLVPNRQDTDLIVVLPECETDARLCELIGAITDDATNAQGTVLGVLGSLILIAFGMPLSQSNGPQLRATLVAQLMARYGSEVRIIHGRWSSLAGNLGGNTRFAYTAIPSDFTQILRQLSDLRPGEVIEHEG